MQPDLFSVIFNICSFIIHLMFILFHKYLLDLYYVLNIVLCAQRIRLK